MNYSILPVFKNGYVSFMMVRTDIFDSQIQQFLKGLGNNFSASFGSRCVEDLNQICDEPHSEVISIPDVI